jgi:hypothetical protein
LWDEGLRIISPGSRYGVDVLWPTIDQYNCPSTSVSVEQDGPFGLWANNWNLPASCPTSYGTYGSWVGTRAEELNVVLCWSSIQELQATLQFSIPGWKIQALQADERTIRTISSNMETQLDLNGAIFNRVQGDISTALDGSFSTSFQTRRRISKMRVCSNTRISKICMREYKTSMATVRLCLYYVLFIKQHTNVTAAIRHKS